VTVHYDPQIASQFTIHKNDLDIRPHWGKVAAKALLIRGAQSDVLPRDVADDLVASGPKPALFEVSGAGHAPTLASDAEIALLRDFLRS
ncbi:MAG TPA: alpha/beta hydrolase, partial [Rhizobiaceae bacterium]|nr:alpha/beta hydrolase [Rhizobiaceae bacterium]